MRKIKYIMLFILGMGLFNSCVDDTTNYDLNDNGPNVAGFAVNSTTISGIADGTEYSFYMKVKIVGPTVTSLTKDITLTVAAANIVNKDTTTAIAGTHYTIVNPTIVLKKSDNYLGLIEVKMLTTGIVTPLPKNPKLVLQAVSATGDSKVVANGKPLVIDMNFACYTELEAKMYNMHVVSSTGATRDAVEPMYKIGVETYMTKSVGTWTTAPFISNGYIFTNSCNVLDVPLTANKENGLAATYSNEVWGHLPGKIDPVTGVITLNYTIWFAAGNRTYVATYTPIP